MVMFSENYRFISQDGSPIKKKGQQISFGDYLSPHIIRRPEFAIPLVASFAAAAGTALGLDNISQHVFDLKDTFLNSAFTFAVSAVGGVFAKFGPIGVTDIPQRRLGIMHHYFDKYPQEGDTQADHQEAAGKMKRLHMVFAGAAVVGVSVVAAKLGIAPELWGAATAIVTEQVAMTSRYAKVENGTWALHNPLPELPSHKL